MDRTAIGAVPKVFSKFARRDAAGAGAGARGRCRSVHMHNVPLMNQYSSYIIPLVTSF